MQRVTRSVHITAPPEQVWAVLEDVRLLPELSPGTVEVVAPERLSAVGETFEQTVELAGRRFTSTWTVLEIEPLRRLVIEGSVLPGTRYRLTEELEAEDGGTRLSVTMEYRLPFGPVGRLVGRLGAERRALEEAAQVLEGVRRVVGAA